MYMILGERADSNCPAGTQFYLCASNQFSGCCGVDPCDLPTCPSSLLSAPTDAPTSSPSAGVSAQHSLSSSVPTSTPHPLTSSSPSSTTSSASSSSIASSISSSTSTNSLAPSTTTGIAAASPAAGTNTASLSPNANGLPTAHSSSKVPIIVGVVVGIIAFALLLFLLWFLIRRRRQRVDISNSRPSQEKSVESKLDNGSNQDPRLLAGGDVFAPFGGWFRSPKSGGRFPAHGEDQTPREIPHDTDDSDTQRDSRTALLQDSPRDATSPSSGVLRRVEMPADQPRIRNNATPEHDTEDTPLPDCEKSDVAPPDLAQHPAYSQESITSESSPGHTDELGSTQPLLPGLLPNSRYNPAAVPRSASPVPGCAELPAKPISKAKHSQKQHNNAVSVNRTASRDTIGSTYTITVGLGTDDRSQNPRVLTGAVEQAAMSPNLRPTIEEEVEARFGDRTKHVMSWTVFEDEPGSTPNKAGDPDSLKEGPKVRAEESKGTERWSGSTVTSESGRLIC